MRELLATLTAVVALTLPAAAQVPPIQPPPFSVSLIPGGAITNAMLANSSLTIGTTSISLGATAPTLAGVTSYNKVAITAPATGSTLTLADGKTLTVNNSLTLAGTDGAVQTFQASDTIVGRATSDTLTNKTFDTAGTGNVLKINGTQVSAVTGSGAAVLATSPALTTPNLGVATATSINGLTTAALGVLGTAPVQASSGTTGNDVDITASNATAGSSSNTGVNGGNVNITAGLGTGNVSGVGAGGAVTITAGASSGYGQAAAGNATLAAGGGTFNGGFGGNVAVASGVGGLAGSGFAGGTSGTASLTSAAGGNSNAASTAAGASGNVTVGSGAGGTASGTTSNGGNSGSVTISTGAAGTGTSANGAVGNIIFAPGGTTGATLTPTLLALGSGTTNAFPGLKRNGTAVNFRLADNSADAPITASTGTFSGALTGYEATTTKTSNYNVAVADVAQHFDNTGASGEVDFTLPAYAAGLRYCFTVTAAQTLKVIAPASNKIAIGTTNSAAAGNITASATYSTACIYATAVSNQWVAESTTGSWTVN